jgi:holo-ACP synthase
VTARPVTLAEVLLNREQRVQRQRQALAAYGRPLLSITPVNPGPVKDSTIARYLLAEALDALDSFLTRPAKTDAPCPIHSAFSAEWVGDRESPNASPAAGGRWPELHRQVRNDPTGPEALLVVDAEAHALKEATTRLEDEHPLGRLWDIDVIDPLRGAISRKDLGQPSRRCLLCAEDAHACARSRAHSLDELQRAMHRMVHAYRES